MVAKTKLIDQPSSPYGFLVVRQGKRSGKNYKLHQVTKIGRNATNDIILDNDTVSAEHVTIKFEHGCFVLYDLASTNHTKINDQVVQKQLLVDGDKIQLGDVSLVFKEVRG